MHRTDAPEPPARDPFTVDAAGLGVVSVSGTGSTLITLTGELDHATRPTFDQAVNHALRAGPPTLVIDLAGLEFLAVAGGHAFEEADRRCRRAGGRLVLLNPGRPVLRLLALFGITGLIEGPE